MRGGAAARWVRMEAIIVWVLRSALRETHRVLRRLTSDRIMPDRSATTAVRDAAPII